MTRDFPPSKDWPADKVERRAVSSLVPYAKNARTHSAGQIEQIAASIRQWGWTMPCLVDEVGELIAGHGRLLAAQSLGLAEVPVMVASGWTEAQKRAYRLADNQLALNAEWDSKALGLELGALKEGGFDLGLVGFDPQALRQFMASPRGDPDEVPDAPATPISRTGDLWLLGEHRVLCGDATKAEDVGRLLGGAKPHLMVTDPPYGVEYDPEWREGADLGVGKRSKGKVKNDDRVDWRESWELFPGDVAYVWHAGCHAAAVQASLESAGFQVRSQIIWAKQHFALSRGHYHWQHEPCFYAVRKSESAKWQGDRKQTTVWEIANNNSFGNQGHEQTWGHGTQKPVECMRRPIVNNSVPGDAVYDPFLGSGTTLIAAEIEVRNCFGIEIHPPYVDLAVRRWQTFTGRRAQRLSDGVYFDDASYQPVLASA